jgi:hypothetical protein
LCFSLVKSSLTLFCQGSLIPVLSFKIYLFLSFQGWRTVIYTVSSGMDFPPIFCWELINVDVIFLFGDILNTAEHEDIVLENEHRVSSSLGGSVLGFDFLPLFSGEWKFPEVV